MGYDVKVHGQIDIWPSITFDQFTEDTLEYIRTYEHRPSSDACFVVEGLTIRDDEVIDATIVGIEATYPTEGFSNSRLGEDAEKLMAMYPDRTFSGFLECSTADDGGSLWRLVARPNGRIVEVQPRITVEWPDEPQT